MTLFPASATNSPLLTQAEQVHLYGMTHWLPRAYPTAPGTHLLVRLSRQKLAEYGMAAKAVHFVAGEARRALLEGGDDVQAVHSLADISVAYLATVPQDHALRRVVDLDIIQSAHDKLSAYLGKEAQP